MKNKINMIKKYFKKNKLILDLELINYGNYNLYIRIDYIKKKKVYMLYWFDLDIMDKLDVESYMNSECLYGSRIDKIIDTIKNNADTTKLNKIDGDECIVRFTLYDEKEISFQFNKYIPIHFEFLSGIFIFIFNNLPKKLEGFLEILHAELLKTKMRYEYKKSFVFDLFNDELKSIFDYQIIQRGENYYNENRILFLEKIDDKYFGVVEGTEKYVVIIDYNEEKKELQVYCSCPCEFYCKHIYAVILAIRNKEENRFYKIAYKDKEMDLLERLMTFNYKLCLGLVESNLELVNDNGEIELIPILNKEGENNWEVLEDDEDMSLSKEIQERIRYEKRKGWKKT